MPKSAVDYFRYFASSPESEAWGIEVTAAGHTHIAAGTAYPPSSHPTDHSLDWDRGRVLDAFQLVLITAGRGRFESHASGQIEVTAGAGFIVFPGIWHRYVPDVKTGWIESWMEVRGPVVDQLIARGVFQETNPVRAGLIKAGAEEALEAVHQRSRGGQAGFDARRAAGALAALAAWEEAAREEPTRSRLEKAVERAEVVLAEQFMGEVNVRELAASLGVAYSHFRRAFKQHTGFAPWQYVLHLRMARARRLLASGDQRLDEIGEILGFSSAFHFSATFKRTHGVSPHQWRQELWRGGVVSGE